MKPVSIINCLSPIGSTINQLHFFVCCFSIECYQAARFELCAQQKGTTRKRRTTTTTTRVAQLTAGRQAHAALHPHCALSALSQPCSCLLHVLSLALSRLWRSLSLSLGLIRHPFGTRRLRLQRQRKQRKTAGAVRIELACRLQV